MELKMYGTEDEEPEHYWEYTQHTRTSRARAKICGKCNNETANKTWFESKQSLTRNSAVQMHSGVGCGSTALVENRHL